MTELTTNLSLTQLDVGQKEKEVTINTNNSLIDAKIGFTLADAGSDPSATGKAPGTTYYDTVKKVVRFLRVGSTWNTMNGYIGEGTSDPATTGLQSGSLYYNTSTSKLKVLLSTGSWANAA